MKNSLRIIATMVAKRESVDAVRTLLTPAVAEFRAEPGCHGYILHEDKKSPGRFITYEAWTDEAALAQHMKSPAMKALEPKLKPLLAAEIEQVFLSILVES